MSDNKNKSLNAEQRGQLEAWIVKFWKVKSRTCPVCEQTNWQIPPHMVVGITMSSSGDLVLGGGSYPNVLFVCDNCGYTHHINASKMGIKLAKDQPEVSDG